MKFCEECGKKLSFFEGYRHPVMGKEYLLCCSCFNVTAKSVEEWRKLVTANTYNKDAKSYVDLLQECKGILLSSHFNFLVSILK